GGRMAGQRALGGAPVLDRAAVIAASTASWFAARYLGAENPQWYVAAPGLALVAVGLAMPHDRRLTAGTQRLGTPATAVGATLLLGTTAAQAFADTGW